MKPFVVLRRLFAAVGLLATITLSQGTLAAVESPYLELEFLTGDERVTLTTGALRNLSLEGQATTLFTTATDFTDIPDVPFILTMLITSTTSDGFGGFEHNVVTGMLDLDGGALLTASLSNITLDSFGSDHLFSADVNFIAGSISPDRIEGSFTGPVADLSLAYDSIGTEILNAKLGSIDAVVPVPAAIWLFGSALFGLIRIRKT